MEVGLIHVCKRLPVGMLLRMMTVCKKWRKIIRRDEIWLLVLAREAKPLPGLSRQESISVNYKIYSVKVKNERRSARKIYMKNRRLEFKMMELRKPGSTEKYRIFI
jgi:hypothetical protein